MSCFWGHKWCNWETYDLEFKKMATILEGEKAGTSFSTGYAKELRQQRTCKTCGKKQDILIAKIPEV